MMTQRPGKVIINGNTIELQWFRWYGWGDLQEKEQNEYNFAIAVPDKKGVYEVAYKDSEHPCGKRLYIGSGNIRTRVRNLLKGKDDHKGGKRLHQAIGDKPEKTENIRIRWAKTEECVEVERCLFMRYIYIHR